MRYARVSTEERHLTAQRNGTNRERPGPREAMAACGAGDTFVVTRLDRLARSLPDARDILEGLTKRDVKLSMNGSVHQPNHVVGRLLSASVTRCALGSRHQRPSRAQRPGMGDVQIPFRTIL